MYVCSLTWIKMDRNVDRKGGHRTGVESGLYNMLLDGFERRLLNVWIVERAMSEW